MNKRRSGFTLVEVSLFLALTGLLFLGVIVGMQNSISQQRYNDATQNFADFLRTTYAKVANVQGTVGPESGKSDKAFYGKLVVFGESETLNGENNVDGRVYIYDVVGKIGSVGGGDALGALKTLNADVVVDGKDASGNTTWAFAGITEEYIPRWGAAIQSVISDELYAKGALLIVRHATSGTINTYVKKDDTLEINQDFNDGISAGIMASKWDDFKAEEIDFCVNPSGNFQNDNRRDIRIIQYARNASGVETISLDENKIEDGQQVGNRCRYNV